jgi:hypothetical protein
MSLPKPPEPRMVANDDVIVHVRSVIADVYADAVACGLPPYQFARRVMNTMRDDHLYFVARIDIPERRGRRR